MAKITAEQFIEKANIIHKEKYDYSRVKFEGNNTKVEIICSIHGIFEKIPRTHLKGESCPQCGYDKKQIILKRNKKEQIITSEYFKAVKKEHKNQYTYDESSYTELHSKIVIICSKHGKFKIPANHHLEGRKCTKCVIEEGEKDES